MIDYKSLNKEDLYEATQSLQDINEDMLIHGLDHAIAKHGANAIFEVDTELDKLLKYYMVHKQLLEDYISSHTQKLKEFSEKQNFPTSWVYKL